MYGPFANSLNEGMHGVNLSRDSHFSLDLAMKVHDVPSDPLPQRSLTIMEPYLKGMRLMKLLGLPMKATLAEDGSIVFEEHRRLLIGGIAAGNISLVNLTDCTF